MSGSTFDEHAAAYDGWFLKNRNVLQSEVQLVARFLHGPGKALSVGCGSGLFEMILRDAHDIHIRFGVEPAEGMAEIATKRGLEVQVASAEKLPFEDASFDTVLFNGTPSYIRELATAFAEAHRVLRPGGRVVVCDVPAESSYALLYRLAVEIGTWDDPFPQGVAPSDPYPMEFAAAANWRTTQEKLELLEAAGFTVEDTAQTLTVHPLFSDDAVEAPSPGHDRGDYVAILARK